MVEAFRPLGRPGIRLGRTVAGTLPGPYQSAEGAELYSLLIWLRHLDPLSRLTPRFHSDSQREVDGWHRRWDTADPWTPHRELWQQIEYLRDDVRPDVEVIWIKGHLLAAAAGICPRSRLFRHGNRAADCLAREATKWHPADVEVNTSLQRTHSMAQRLRIA